MSILKLKNISKNFGAIEALDDVSLVFKFRRSSWI